jgi:hypothetical protein
LDNRLVHAINAQRILIVNQSLKHILKKKIVNTVHHFSYVTSINKLIDFVNKHESNQHVGIYSIFCLYLYFQIYLLINLVKRPKIHFNFTTKIRVVFACIKDLRMCLNLKFFKKIYIYNTYFNYIFYNILKIHFCYILQCIFMIIILK